MSHIIRRYIKLVESHLAEINMGSLPEPPKDCEYCGDIWIEIEANDDGEHSDNSLSPVSINDKGTFEKWLDKVMDSFGFEWVGGGISTNGGDAQFKSQRNSRNAIEAAKQVLHVGQEIQALVAEYQRKHMSHLDFSAGLTLYMQNERKNWYGQFADYEDLELLVNGKLTPAQVLFKRRDEGDFQDDGQPEPDDDTIHRNQLLKLVKIISQDVKAGEKTYSNYPNQRAEIAATLLQSAKEIANFDSKFADVVKALQGNKKPLQQKSLLRCLSYANQMFNQAIQALTRDPPNIATAEIRIRSGIGDLIKF